MRSSNLNLAHGTNGNPQSNLEQYEHAAMVAKNEGALKEFADNLPLIDLALIAEMEESGVKFNKDEVILTTRDATGQLIWLEKGTSAAGYAHIQKRHHDEQLATYLNVATDEIPRVLRNIIAYGTVIDNNLVMRRGRPGYERKYEYNGKKVILAAVGANGFLITAYPYGD